MLTPDLKRQGYDEDSSAALIVVSSIMAPLVPPSIAMVLYAALFGTSISRLFVAGIVPGVMLAIALSAHAAWVAARRGHPELPPVGLAEVGRILGRCAPVLLLAVVVMGGIRGGVVNRLVGFATPPVGLCLSVMAGVTGRPIEAISIHALPMVGLAILVLVPVPGVVLVLPDLLVE